MEDFRQTISDLGLQDLGFQGNNFTWFNGREGVDNIQVGLDRALANPMWRLWFPAARVFHLLRFKSDHDPIFLDCELWVIVVIGKRGKERESFVSRKCG
ncbi:hypothetical protein ACS0TY_013991 [Phlomoides rotata]